jgi:hypothetical protein
LEPVTSLDATLTRPPVSVDSKPLTGTLSLLDATLTKNRGEGAVIVNQTSGTVNAPFNTYDDKQV